MNILSKHMQILHSHETISVNQMSLAAIRSVCTQACCNLQFPQFCAINTMYNANRVFFKGIPQVAHEDVFELPSAILKLL